MSNQASYAHLLSSVRNAKSAGSAKEVDPDETERMESEPPKNDKEDGKKAKKKAKASDDEGDEDEKREDDESDKGEDEEESEDRKEDKERKREDKEDKKGKKKAKAEFSGDLLQAAVLEERLRCAQIFRSKAAAGRPHVAAQFAFHTDLSADSAIAIMETLSDESAEAAPRNARLDDRMARVPNANVGHDVSSDRPSQMTPASEAQVKALSSDQKALMIVNAGRERRGEEPLKSLPK